MSKSNKLPQITEEEFTNQVLAFAKLHGWRTAHFRPARTPKGWRTAVSGDGAGFPDLIMLREGKIVVAELKVGKNKPSPEQDEWLLEFSKSLDAFVHLWYPKHWPEIETVLKR